MRIKAPKKATRVKLYTLLCLIGLLCPQLQNISWGQDTNVSNNLSDTIAIALDVDSNEKTPPFDSTTTPTTSNTPSGNKKTKVYKFEIAQDIMAPAWELVRKAVDSAEANKADVILIRMNTYGGAVDIADSIRTKLLRAKPTVIVYIDVNAASAGVLISVACDSIYMAPGSKMGSSTVVDGSGNVLPEKYQSYMRATFRSTAEAQGRNPKLAEAFVTSDTTVQGLVDSGQVLAMTPKQAMKYGFCEGEAKNINEVLALAGITNYEMIEHKETTIDKINGFLLNPFVNGLLMMIIIGGIYFELQTPGVGFPLAAAITAAVLLFAPLYMEGLAENWEIALFVVGLILLALEIFVIPGFGVAGVSGIILCFAGLTLSLVDNVAFDFSMTGFDEIVFAMFRVMIPILAAIGLLLLFGNSLLNTGLFKRMMLQTEQQAVAGYSTNIFQGADLKGKEGVAMTKLRPSGKVEVEGEWYDAMADGDWIEQDEKVVVYQMRSNHIVVRKIRT